MQTGIIRQGIGGFYHVVLDSGESLTCRPRGRFKKEGLRLLAGDRVLVRVTGEGEGVIEEVQPRRTELRRPPIANVDCVLVVMALSKPRPDRFYIDRLLVAISGFGLQALLCFNKADEATPEEAEEWARDYRSLVERVLITSALRGTGIDQLIQALQGRITALAGPSGVGKSALLNALNPDYRRQTGEVSRKLARGRHTTRSVELLPLPGGGWVADTPGFSQIDLSHVESAALDRHFPDLAPLAQECRFSGCRHRKEPGCRVREAFQAGEIHSWRYQHYLEILAELEELEALRYR